MNTNIVLLGLGLLIIIALFAIVYELMTLRKIKQAELKLMCLQALKCEPCIDAYLSEVEERAKVANTLSSILMSTYGLYERKTRK